MNLRPYWKMIANKRLRPWLIIAAVLLLIYFVPYLDLKIRNVTHIVVDRKGHRSSAELKHPGTNPIDGTLENNIPNYILRTFKTANREEILESVLNGSDLAKGRYDWFHTWEGHNPNHVQILFNDDDLERFVQGTFSPFVVDAFFKLPRIVLRADFARYLMLYEFGGVYTDMDTECWTPIDYWTFGHDTVAAIIGVELFGTVDGLDQFTQWTMALAPKHPFMKKLILGLAAKIHSSHVESMAEVDGVVGFTGPVYWSQMWWQYFREQEFDLQAMQGLDRSYKIFGNVMVLGHTYFRDPSVFSYHHFAGELKNGWKNVKVPEKSISKTAYAVNSSLYFDTATHVITASNRHSNIPLRIMRPIRTNSRLQLSKNFQTNNKGASQAKWFGSWDHFNKKHLQLLFGDDDLDRFVRGGFSKRIVGAYSKLPVDWRGEFGRYLMLYKFGGVIVDSLNVECLVPLNKWDFGVQALDLILGLEDNESLRFSQTVVAAGPQNPFVLALIRYITDKLVNMSPAEAKDRSNFSATVGRTMFQAVAQQFFSDQSAELLKGLGDSRDGYFVITGRGGKTLLLGSKFTSGSDALFKGHK
ncbi:hypothetical protein BDR26DRAFT_937999 [Obelidium mucronatum]|nr:hypothetical protein BDR26DRAFT_937999 [Obelidium mucronatum]